MLWLRERQTRCFKDYVERKKKEYEELEKLTKYECTQVEMPLKIQMALGRRLPDPKLQLRQVCQSPYVYYADFSTPTYLRSLYRKKWPNAVSRNRVAVLDTERDVTFGTNETVLTSVTMGKKKIDQMNKLEKLFYEGGEKNGHPHATLNKIWEDWKKFASYAFNKRQETKSTYCIDK